MNSVTSIVKGKRGASLLLWLFIFLLIIAAAWLIRSFLYQPVIAPDHSMLRTIVSDDVVLVNKWIYSLKQPERGDIVAVRTPRGYELKRIVGLPGETIVSQQNRVWINGHPLSEPYLENAYTQDIPLQTVPADSYYVLGDNRSESYDSRFFGSVTDDQLLGRVEGVYWPLSHLQFGW